MTQNHDSQPEMPSPPPILQTRQLYHNSGHQPNSLLFRLPNDLLIKILDDLDPVTLESLRRTARVFMRVLPDIYPNQFSRTLQGDHPWPVRRIWTLGRKQREELVTMIGRSGTWVPVPVVQGSLGAAEAGVMMGVEKEGTEGDQQVVCRTWMQGLEKAWRFIPCASCRGFHPAAGVSALYGVA